MMPSLKLSVVAPWHLQTLAEQRPIVAILAEQWADDMLDDAIVKAIACYTDTGMTQGRCYRAFWPRLETNDRRASLPWSR